MKFRTKPDAAEPATIDAIQYCGQKNLPKVLDFILDGHFDFSHLPISPEHGNRGVAMEAKTGDLRIPVEEGIDICRSGDWVVRSAAGKFSAINQRVLDDNYESSSEVIPCPPATEANVAGSDECAVGGAR